MPSSVHVSREKVVSNDVLNAKFFSNDHSLSLQLNNMRKKLAECKVKLKVAIDKSKILFEKCGSE